MSKRKSGEEFTVNGKKFVWNDKTRSWGRWRKKNGERTFVPMTQEEAAQAVEYFNSLPTPPQIESAPDEESADTLPKWLLLRRNDDYDSFTAGFSFDRARREWRERNGVDLNYMEKYRDQTISLESAVSTIKDVQALMAYGWEFAVKYKNCEAFISAFGQTFYIEAECDGKDYWWDAYTLEEFEDAMVGPYRLKDIVDKWEITEFC